MGPIVILASPSHPVPDRQAAAIEDLHAAIA